MTVKQYISIKGQLRAAFSAVLAPPITDIELFRLALAIGRYKRRNAA